MDRRRPQGRAAPLPAALGIPKGNILLEPEGKNTAPAVALAAAVISAADPGAVILATPADHAIANVRAFHAVIRKGLALARETGDSSPSASLRPTHPPGTGTSSAGRRSPERRGAPSGSPGSPRSRTWHGQEVPALGRFDWNSGLFAFRTDTFAESLARHLPEVEAAIREAMRGGRKGFARRLPEAYRRMPSISIDYGILEKEKGILVLPAEMDGTTWGHGASLHEFLGEEGGNVTFGDVILNDCRNTLVRTDKGLVAVLGMEDTVVVRCGDAVLVCPRSRSEDVKGMVAEVRKRFPSLA